MIKTPPHFTQRKKNIHTQAGVSLLEVLVSLLVFSVGVLGIVGLHTAASKNAGEPQYRAVAAALANDMTAQYWLHKTDATGTGFGTGSDIYINWIANIEQALPNGTGTTSYDSVNHLLQIKICWQASGSDQHCHETHSQIGHNK